MDRRVAVYILLCTDHTCYCGITANLLQRILQHTYTPSYYMRSHRIARLLWYYDCPDRHTAAILERSIKRTGVAKFTRRQYADHGLQFPA